MEVPCCGGLQYAAENALRASGKFIPWQVVTIAENALRASGKFIPWQVVTISIDGRILD